jgi:cathepsin B
MDCDSPVCKLGYHPSRTLLASTRQFKEQFAALNVDRAAGAEAGAKLAPPEEFDGRVVWKDFMPPIRNQGLCGSCWAFSTTACLSERLAIATRGAVKVTLSPAAMVMCDIGGEEEYQMAVKLLAAGVPYDRTSPERVKEMREWEASNARKLGCSGESLIGAWQYLYRFGAIEETCVPYSGKYKGGVNLGETPEDVPPCGAVIGDNYDTCPTNGKPARRFRTFSYYYVPGVPGRTRDQVLGLAEDNEKSEGGGPGVDTGTEETIRREIYHWGPVTTGFAIHGDFMRWDGRGIYSWDGKPEEGDIEPGGHAVTLVGWGTDKQTGVPYWIARNSWGTEWGDNGCFKIKRGSNECTIEENVFVGFPELPGFRLYAEHPILFSPEDLTLRALWRVAPSGHKHTTLEMMLDGKIDPQVVDVDELIVDSDAWPALNTYVAGLPNKTKFPMKRSVLRTIIHPRDEKERNRIVRAGILVSGILLGAGIAYYYFVVSKKR